MEHFEFNKGKREREEGERKDIFKDTRKIVS